MNVLIIVAHPDDEVLGAGGTIFKHSLCGDEICLCIMCSNADARVNISQKSDFREQIKKSAKVLGIKDVILFDYPNIRMNTIPTLSIVQSIESVIIKCCPDIVYTHHYGDLNEDHRIVNNATMVAVRLPERNPDLKLPLIKEILSFEIPSSTDWAPFIPECNFLPNTFCDISDTFKVKIKALKIYQEIIRPYPHPISQLGLEARARVRGMQGGIPLAEAFMLMRLIR